MTQKEKELLLTDLCARLPYKPKVQCESYCGMQYDVYDMPLDVGLLGGFIVGEENIKPYLRLMSSMTEDEKEKLKDICTMYDCDMGSDWESFGLRIFDISHYGTAFKTDYAAIDWLNSYHFDYHGLIEKGLALEAPEGMYKEE